MDILASFEKMSGRLKHQKTLFETNSLPLKIEMPKRILVFQASIFRGYVSFRDGNVSKSYHLTDAFLTKPMVTDVLSFSTSIWGH